MSESNVELARRGYEAALRGDLDLIGDLLDPEVTWHGGDPTAEGGCHNRDEALAFMRAAFERGGPGELVDVVDAGDKVVLIMRRASALTANVTTFRAGKVVEMVHYPDPDAALAAAEPLQPNAPPAPRGV
jgi:ketosteroid isomerase-like protein